MQCGRLKGSEIEEDTFIILFSKTNENGLLVVCTINFRTEEVLLRSEFRNFFPKEIARRGEIEREEADNNFYVHIVHCVHALLLR